MASTASVSSPGGLDPVRLDPTIEAAVDRLGKCVADVERVRATLEPLLDTTRARLEKSLAEGGLPDDKLIPSANRLVDWLEKYSRVSLSMLRVLDDAARLRSFLAGGPDSRSDLSSLSDTELADIVRKAAATVKP